ncbi:MAG: nucleotide exchange factor GrpE [Acidaminococcaceae bacterium]|nr:nucleotide exchange factor GrpE [Acidaminococcaceae bacterium]
MRKKEVKEVLEEIRQDANGAAEAATTETEAASETPPVLEADERDAKLEDLQNKLLRLQADFDNYRRRTAKEQTQLASFVTVSVVEKFLSVLDSFDRAEESIAKANDVESIRVGLEMIQRQLKQVFMGLKVEEIPAKGEKFDPLYHEAVMRGENSELEDDTVEAVFEKGYKLEDKVIRHSKVKVVSNG